MSEAWVVDASPLILFHKAGIADLLLEVAPSLIVPETVANEAGPLVMERYVASGPGVTLAANLPIPTEVAVWGLDPGESQVLVHGLGGSSRRVVLDDRAGRRAASALGLAVTGSLGIVLRAKRSGLIPSAEPILKGLRDTGLYVSDRLFREALALVDE